MSHLVRDVLHWIDHSTPQQWLFILIGVIVVGMVALKGFGSRSQY